MEQVRLLLIGVSPWELGCWSLPLVVALSVWVGLWLGQRGSTEDQVVEKVEPIVEAVPMALLPEPIPEPEVVAVPSPPGVRRFELLHEVDGEFVPTGEVVDETEASAHEIVLSRQATTGIAHAARIIPPPAVELTQNPEAPSNAQ